VQFDEPVHGFGATVVGAAGGEVRQERLTPLLQGPRLVGAVLAEQTDEWAEGRRYLGLDVLARSRLTVTTTDPEIGADTMPALTALGSARK